MSTPTILAEPAPARTRRRWWPIPAAVAIVLLAAGATSALVAVRHYAKAEPLRCACAIMWAAPDDRFAHEVADPTDPAGDTTRLQVPARAGHTQSFYIFLINPSSVTQTILGLPPVESVREPDHLAVASDAGRANQDEPGTRRFTAAPTDIPPGGVRWVRMSHQTAAYGPGRTEFFDLLVIRVRTGGFTRTENIPLDNSQPSISWG